MIIIGILVGLIPIVNLVFIITGLATIGDPDYPVKSITEDAVQFHIGAILGIIICYMFLYRG